MRTTGLWRSVAIAEEGIGWVASSDEAKTNAKQRHIEG